MIKKPLLICVLSLLAANAAHAQTAPTKRCPGFDNAMKELEASLDMPAHPAYGTPANPGLERALDELEQAVKQAPVRATPAPQTAPLAAKTM